MNDGHPFDSKDIERLLTPCLGGKDFEKTGAMNLGALSVLSISDSVFYHSGKVLLRFIMDHENEEFFPEINENYESYFNGTRLILPFHSRLSSNDIKKLDKIDEYLTKYSPLLFTLRLKKIILEYPNKKFEISKDIEKEIKAKNKKTDASLMTIVITENFIKGRKTHEVKKEWFVAKREVIIPKKYFSAKELEEFSGDIKLPIYLAFYLEKGLPKRVDYPIYIIFPSDTSFGLGCVLSSNFKPETSRK